MMRFLSVARRCLGALTGAILIALMVVAFVDVVGRYLVSQPLPGGHVLVQCLVCLLVFAGLPAVVLSNDFIRVRLVDAQMSAPVRKLRDRLVNGLIAVALTILAGQLVWQARYFAQNGEYLESIGIPLSWIAGYAAACSAAAALFAILRVFIQPRSEESDA